MYHCRITNELNKFTSEPVPYPGEFFEETAVLTKNRRWNNETFLHNVSHRSS